MKNPAIDWPGAMPRRGSTSPPIPDLGEAPKGHLCADLRKAITICLNSWPPSRMNRTKQKRMPRVKSPRLDEAEPRRRARLEQRRSGERIGMIADVSGIGALNHPDAGVMANRYNAHRDACEQLAHYVAVPQGINRDFFQASLFSYSGERSGMIG